MCVCVVKNERQLVVRIDLFQKRLRSSFSPKRRQPLLHLPSPSTLSLSLSLAWISRYEEDVRPSIVNTLSPFLPPLERGLVKLATGRWADDGRLAEASPASRRLSSAEGDARARDWPNKYVPFLPCFFSSGRSRASGREQTGEAFLAFVCMSTSSAATSSGKDNVC
jgi:hypothetical protein